MIKLEIIEYFPEKIRRGSIKYTQAYTVNLPIKGPATVDVGEGAAKKEVVVHFPVNYIEASDAVSQAYVAEREKRRSPDFRYPNELVANLISFYLNADGFLQWKENMTDWSVLNGILRNGLLYEMPKEEQERILRKLAPSAPAAVVESTDGYIVVGGRGEDFHLAGQIMPFPAGHPVYNPSTDSLESPWEALDRESREELNFSLGEAKSFCIIGAVRGHHGSYGSWNPAIVYCIEAGLDIKQLEERHKNAPDRPENKIFLPTPADSRHLSEFLKTKVFERDGRGRHKLIDNGLGELLLYGRYRFGDSWYEQLIQELTSDPRYETAITEGNPFK